MDSCPGVPRRFDWRPLLAGVALSALLARWIGDDSASLAPAVLSLAIGAAALVTLANWRAGLCLFLVWLTFEDLPRKYLGNNMRIYFAKDVLALLTYVAFLLSLLRGRSRSFRPPFLLPLAAFLALGVCQVFNPNSPSLFYGLMGLKLYFYYIPLTFLGYAFIRSAADLDRFLLFSMAVATVVATLGIAQAIVGLDFLNPSALPPELNLIRVIRQAPISRASVERPTSVFVSEGRFGWYVLLMFLLGLGGAGYLQLRAHPARKLFFGAVGILAMAVILTGSRGTFLTALGSGLVAAAAFLWYSPRLWRPRLSRALQWTLAAGGLALIAVLALFPEAVGSRWAFYYETLAPWSPSSELGWRVWGYPVSNFLGAFEAPHWPTGYGIGTAGLGVQYVRAFFGAPGIGLGPESGYATLLIEMGVPGLVLWMIWTAALVKGSWKVLGSLRVTPLFPVGFSIFWFAFVLLFPFTFGGLLAYQNFIFNAYLWLLVGILFKLPALRVSVPFSC